VSALSDGRPQGGRPYKIFAKLGGRLNVIKLRGMMLA
jgi:hypothetical protein